MSDRPCNLCELAQIISEAVKAGRTVSLKPDTGLSGLSKDGVTVRVDRKFKAWFMSVPKHCAC